MSGVAGMGLLQVIDSSSARAEERSIGVATTVLGRATDADWQFDEPTVSRHHAAVHHVGDRDEIEDLGSTAGTLVNGELVRGRRVLRPGDVVQLAEVRLRYLSELGAETAVHEPAAARTFTVDDQRAGVLSNIAGDQYNQYVQHVIVQREDAFRQIASMNRVSRGLTLTGMSMFIAGILGFMATGILEMARGQPDMSSFQAFQDSTRPIEVLGVPLFALAMGVAIVGFAVLALGMIMHLAASTRTKQVERQYPLPPGWGPPNT